jgi:arginase
MGIVSEGTKAFGLSVDLDGFDPKDAPATGSLEENGVCAKEALVEFEKISYHPKFKALEIAEFNPTLPGKEKTLELMQDILLACSPKKGLL